MADQLAGDCALRDARKSANSRGEVAVSPFMTTNPPDLPDGASPLAPLPASKQPHGAARRSLAGAPRRASWFMLVVGLGSWLAGLRAPWVVAPGRANVRGGHASGFEIAETVWLRGLLLAASTVTVLTARRVARRRGGGWPAMALIALCAMAGVAGAVGAGVAIGQSTSAGAVRPGVGPSIVALAAGLSALGAARLAVTTWAIKSSRPFPQPKTCAIVGLVAIACGTATPLVSPQPGTPSIASGLTVIAGGGQKRARPAGEVREAQIEGVVTVGHATYATGDAYELGSIALLPIVGRRLGGPAIPVPGAFFSATYLGAVEDGEVAYLDDHDELRVVRLDGDDSSSAIVAQHVRSAAVGPDGWLWYSDHASNLYRVRFIDRVVRRLRPVHIAVEPRPARIVGAFGGAAVLQDNDSGILLTVDDEGTVTRLAGGASGTSCRPSADRFASALGGVTVARHDDAGNLWVSTDDGVFVLRAVDGALVDAGPWLAAHGLQPGESRSAESQSADQPLRLNSAASAENMIDVVAESGVVARIDDPAAVAQSLVAIDPLAGCAPLRVDASAVPALVTQHAPTPRDGFAMVAATVLDGWTSSNGSQVSVTRSDESTSTELLLDMTVVWGVATVSADVDGGVWWPAGDGSIRYHLAGKTTTFMPPGQTEFGDVLADRLGAVAIVVAHGSADRFKLARLGVDGSVRESPTVEAAREDFGRLLATDPDRSRVLFVRGDHPPRWVSTVDGTWSSVGRADDQVLSVASDGALIIYRDQMLMRVEGSNEVVLMSTGPNSTPAPTLSQLRPAVTLAQLSLEVTAASEDDGTLYLATADGILLARDSTGSVRYVAGGTDIPGANGIIGKASKISFTATDVVVRSEDRVVRFNKDERSWGRGDLDTTR